MRERLIAKISFLAGVTFICAVIFGGFLGFWDYALSTEAPTVLHWISRLLWGVGYIALFVNLFLMWRHMFLHKNWAWLLSTIVTVFFGSLVYYKRKYEES